MAYAQRQNESTDQWLRRLIAEGAPADVRADVRQLLEGEQQQQHHKLCNL
jgi:hypothetical protein